MTFDFRSIVHVLSSPVYEKPWQTRSFMGRLIGRGMSTIICSSAVPDYSGLGIFSMEGAEHRMQRRIMAPAFTHQAIRNMAPIFFRKAEQLCERWKEIVGPGVKIEEDSSIPELSGVRIDVAHWITCASFDVMGLAGFNYDFHSLQDETEEVYSAYRRMFNIANNGLGMRGILELYFPILRKIFVSDKSYFYPHEV